MSKKRSKFKVKWRKGVPVLPLMSNGSVPDYYAMADVTDDGDDVDICIRTPNEAEMVEFKKSAKVKFVKDLNGEDEQ